MGFIDWLLFIGYFGGVFVVTSPWFLYKVILPVGQKFGYYDKSI